MTAYGIQFIGSKIRALFCKHPGEGFKTILHCNFLVNTYRYKL